MSIIHDIGVDIPAIPLSALAKRGITPQLGLLPDDVLYNLSLLCANILAPVKAEYPGIVVLSGFRQVNTGISQHEKGEAADIHIPSGTPTQLCAVADFIVKTLQFDQVILNFSTRRSPWIHVSFTSGPLRREVLTRDFDDTFHSGLLLSVEKTGEDRAAAERAQAAYMIKINAELSRLAIRQALLNPATIYGDDTSTRNTTGVSEEVSNTGTPDYTVPNFIDVVLSVLAAATWDLTNPIFDTLDASGQFVEAVVKALQDKGETEWSLVPTPDTQSNAFAHAVDAILYTSPTALYNGRYGQVVRVVTNVGTADAEIGWLPVGAPFGDAPVYVIVPTSYYNSAGKLIC